MGSEVVRRLSVGGRCLLLGQERVGGARRRRLARHAQRLRAAVALWARGAVSAGEGGGQGAWSRTYLRGAVRVVVSQVGQARGGQRARQRVGRHSVRGQHARLGDGASLVVHGRVARLRLATEVDESERGEHHGAEQPVAGESARRAPLGDRDASQHGAAAAAQPVVQPCGDSARECRSELAAGGAARRSVPCSTPCAEERSRGGAPCAMYEQQAAHTAACVTPCTNSKGSTHQGSLSHAMYKKRSTLPARPRHSTYGPTRSLTIISMPSHG